MAGSLVFFDVIFVSAWFVGLQFGPSIGTNVLFGIVTGIVFGLLWRAFEVRARYKLAIAVTSYSILWIAIVGLSGFSFLLSLPETTSVKLVVGLTIDFILLGVSLGWAIGILYLGLRRDPLWLKSAYVAWVVFLFVFLLTVNRVLFTFVSAFELGSFALVVTGIGFAKEQSDTDLASHSAVAAFLFFLSGSIVFFESALPSNLGLGQWLPSINSTRDFAYPTVLSSPGVQNAALGSALNSLFFVGCLLLLFLMFDIGRILRKRAIARRALGPPAGVA